MSRPHRANLPDSPRPSSRLPLSRARRAVRIEELPMTHAARRLGREPAPPPLAGREGRADGTLESAPRGVPQEQDPTSQDPHQPGPLRPPDRPHTSDSSGARRERMLHARRRGPPERLRPISPVQLNEAQLFALPSTFPSAAGLLPQPLPPAR